MQLQKGIHGLLEALTLTKHNHSYNFLSIFHMLDTSNTSEISAHHLAWPLQPCWGGTLD